MTLTAHALLIIVAIILWVIAAIGYPTTPRFNLIAAGLAFFGAAFLF